MEPALGHYFHLGSGSIFGTPDNGTSVPHPSARGRSLTRNKSYNRLFVSSLFHPTCCNRLIVAAYFTNHNDSIRLGIVHQHFNGLLCRRSEEHTSELQSRENLVC